MAAKAETLLKEYRKKRDFAKTAEPSGEKAKTNKAGEHIFIVQKHDATRLHYDFRLELDGVLLSWAVTKGPSLNPADKRLAVHVDHPRRLRRVRGNDPQGRVRRRHGDALGQGHLGARGRPARDAQEGRPQVHAARQAAQGQLGDRPHEGPRHRAAERHPARELAAHQARDTYAKTDVDVTEKFKTSVETGRDLEGIAKGLKSKKKTAKALEVPRPMSGRGAAPWRCRNSSHRSLRRWSTRCRKATTGSSS